MFLFILPSGFQTTHPNVIASFKLIANHILEAIPVAFERPPAVIAPRNNARKAPILRFRLGLNFAVSFGSTSKSHKSVVNTTVGISSSARMREAHICPQLGKIKGKSGELASIQWGHEGLPALGR